MTNTNKYALHYSLTAADMDTRYRMTPTAVLLYYQDCWARYMGHLHLAAFDVIKQNLLWIITEFNAWFEPQTAYWADDIEVSVWNSEVSTLRLYAEFEVRTADKTRIAYGYGCWNLIDVTTHKLTPFTPLLPQLPIFNETTSESHKKRRFIQEGTLLQELQHVVNPINLDFNGHVNNRTYLGIAMQSADEPFMDAHAIRCLTIHWHKESFLGDTLVCQLHLLPNDTEKGVYKYLHTINHGDGQMAAQIYSEWGPRTIHIDISEHANRN